MNNCPKCNAKLKTFYFKTKCPQCGTNIMYYNYDKHLEEDAKKAEQEWDFIEAVLNGIKQSTIGSAVAIIRLISLILPIVALLLPVFKIDNQSITLISLIKNIISDSSSVFSSTAHILCFAAFTAVVIFLSLINISEHTKPRLSS